MCRDVIFTLTKELPELQPENNQAYSCQLIGATVGEVKEVADMHQRKAEMARHLMLLLLYQVYLFDERIILHKNENEKKKNQNKNKTLLICLHRFSCLCRLLSLSLISAAPPPLLSANLGHSQPIHIGAT